MKTNAHENKCKFDTKSRNKLLLRSNFERELHFKLFKEFVGG